MPMRQHIRRNPDFERAAITASVRPRELRDSRRVGLSSNSLDEFIDLGLEGYSLRDLGLLAAAARGGQAAGEGLGEYELDSPCRFPVAR